MLLVSGSEWKFEERISKVASPKTDWLISRWGGGVYCTVEGVTGMFGQSLVSYCNHKCAKAMVEQVWRTFCTGPSRALVDWRSEAIRASTP